MSDFFNEKNINDETNEENISPTNDEIFESIADTTTETAAGDSAETISEDMADEILEDIDYIIAEDKTNQAPDNKNFYTEVIENKKKKGSSKKVISMVLIAGLLLGGILGYGADNLLTSRVYAAAPNATNYVIDKTVSPVVPIAQKVSPAIVAIKVKANQTTFFGGTYESSGTGSGIIMDAEGHIVTNNHVIDGATDITIILKDGKELPATLIGHDPVTDLAVLQVSQKGLPYVTFGDSSKLEVGELAIAIGSPMGTEYAGSVTSGIISGLNRKVSVGDTTMTLIQTDAAINPGNSGGALVNSAGEVVGINTLKLIEAQVEGMGFAIPINEAKPIIQDLIQNKKVARPYLGIQGATISKDDAAKYGLPQGIYINDVVAYSGADRAGLKKGDVITKIDGKQVLTIEEVQGIVKQHKIGDILNVVITDKFDKTSTVQVKLSEVTQ